MREYIVNVIAKVIPGDSPDRYTNISTHRVKADTPEHASEAAVAEVTKNNRAIDTMIIEATAVHALKDMPIIYHQSSKDGPGAIRNSIIELTKEYEELHRDKDWPTES